LSQVQRWPRVGRHILAQFDADSVVVYQAYRHEIGRYAVERQSFGGEFSFSRMSWIKTNFLWMMYRSAWGTKPGQEVTLAIRLQRTGFDQILREAVNSSFDSNRYADPAMWQSATAQSSVRLQWDPDHNPSGGRMERRAIQLGLRADALVHYAKTWLIAIEDISAFVADQRPAAQTKRTYSSLLTPREVVYPVYDVQTAQSLGVTSELP
jgi:hypothetical protein